MIGIKGTKEEATQAKEEVGQELEKMDLRLGGARTIITNINKEKAMFLGTQISRGRHTKHKKLKNTPGSGAKRNPKRLRLEAPILRINKKLAEAGFRNEGKAHPKFV